MKHRFLLPILVFVLNASIVFAQDKNYTRHTVAKGETVLQIATKYNVTPYDIYQLNPDAQKGIQENDLILIPASVIKKAENVIEKEKPQVSTNRTHITKPKETLYSLARDYNVTVDDLKSNNPEVAKNGLQIGQVLKILTNKNVEVVQSTSIIKTIPIKEVAKTAVSSDKKPRSKAGIIMHKVEPKETLYSLSKKYNVTVDHIKEQNAALLINGLQIGQVLEIKLNN